MSLNKTLAILVHLLTASGVLCALFALIAITEKSIDVAFLWLGLALVIDTVDGPLARLVDTKTNLPRFSGERLDLIIDYLNYVVLPAFLVIKAPVISGNLGVVAASVILMTSLFHFSDVSSKTGDGYFVGFPAIWNVVVFYFLAFEFNDAVAFLIVVILSVLTFVPFKWLHPIRVVQLRAATVAVVVVWAFVALMTILAKFNVGFVEKSILGWRCCLSGGAQFQAHDWQGVNRIVVALLLVGANHITC